MTRRSPCHAGYGGEHMTDCGYEWEAPYQSPLGARTKVHTKHQVCVLPHGHVGDHQSWSKVTAENRRVDTEASK
jgi:hypothetical protein